MEKNLKICWIKNKGNYIRFYFTTQDDYWGDDWNDAPWEDNAGDVYSEFVEYFVDVIVPFNYKVTHTLNDLYDPYQSNVAIADLVDNNAPFIYVTADCYEPKIYEKIKKSFCHFSFNESIDSFWEKVKYFRVIDEVDLNTEANEGLEEDDSVLIYILGIEM